MSKTTDDINKARVAGVKEYVAAHYGDDLSLATLAEVVHVAPMTLCHIFKRLTGQRVSQFIIHVRIREASKRLRQTNLDIKSISYECGFNTMTNFNRQFKRLTGCTPTEYRTGDRKQ